MPAPANLHTCDKAHGSTTGARVRRTHAGWPFPVRSVGCLPSIVDEAWEQDEGIKGGLTYRWVVRTCCGKRDTVTFCPTDYPPRGNQRHFQLPANTGRVHSVCFPVDPVQVGPLAVKTGLLFLTLYSLAASNSLQDGREQKIKKSNAYFSFLSRTYWLWQL